MNNEITVSIYSEIWLLLEVSVWHWEQKLMFLYLESDEPDWPEDELPGDVRKALALICSSITTDPLVVDWSYNRINSTAQGHTTSTRIWQLKIPM